MTQETIDRIRRFSQERDWDQFHTPANLAKSISIEANELLECFQRSDARCGHRSLAAIERFNALPPVFRAPCRSCRFCLGRTA